MAKWRRDLEIFVDRQKTIGRQVFLTTKYRHTMYKTFVYVIALKCVSCHALEFGYITYKNFQE